MLLSQALFAFNGHKEFGQFLSSDALLAVPNSCGPQQLCAGQHQFFFGTALERYGVHGNALHPLVIKICVERQREQELVASTQRQAEARREAEEAAAERSRLEQQVTAQQRKIDELLEKFQASAQQQSQPVAEQRQSDPPPAPAYTPPPAVSTTYVVNIPPPPPVYYYAPPLPPRVTYYYYPTVRTCWVAPRPYVFVPPAPRYYFRRW